MLSWPYGYAVCMWVTVLYVLLLSHCLITICFMSFVFRYVLINRFIYFLIYSFYVYCLVCLFCFLCCESCVFVLFCVLFLPMYIVVCFLFVYNITDHCDGLETQFHLINK